VLLCDVLPHAAHTAAVLTSSTHARRTSIVPSPSRVSVNSHKVYAAARPTQSPSVASATRRGANGGGPDALAHARQAVALLSKHSARLELAKAESALGEHLAVAGDLTGAAQALRRALDGARLCGADGLAARVESTLAGLA
jgi:hypothetical protein